MEQTKFQTVITSKRSWFTLNFKEVWKYRDLILLFVQRNFKTRYKQTILGPLFFVIQPIFSTVVHSLIFGGLAGLSPDGVPTFLFYFLSNITWQCFSGALTGTSNTFTGNAGIFGKVYFPRLVTPISTIITNVLNLMIQFALFLILWVIFYFTQGGVHLTWIAALFPVLVIQLSLLGMGFGIIISSMTTKYRDLQVFLGFGVQLLMYLTPVVYTATELTKLAGDTFFTIVMLNPVSPIMELMRYGWLGSGSLPWLWWGISWAVTVVVVLLGIMIFNKVEKNFMDTV